VRIHVIAGENIHDDGDLEGMAGRNFIE